MATETQNGTKEKAALVAKDLTTDERRWLDALLSTAGVCSLLTTVGDKVMGANIQAKLQD